MKDKYFYGLLSGVLVTVVVVIVCVMLGLSPVSADTSKEGPYTLTVHIIATDDRGDEIQYWTWHDPILGHSVTMRCARYETYQEAGLTCDWTSVK